jgi:oligopeptide transport system substrate-binding protein
MWKIAAPFVLLLAAILAAVASDRPQPPADYTFINGITVFTLDPQRMSYEQDLRIAHAIYDGLVRWNPYTFEIIPGVAKSWELDDDGVTYTFHLRDNARWSNGDPVTVDDFRYSWRRALMPDTAADYTTLFFKIKGAEAFFNWRSAQLAEYAQRPARERTPEAALALREEANRMFDEIVGFETPDERTIVVTLERPTPYFLDLCAFPVFFPCHPETVERYVSVDPASGRLDQRYDWTKPPLLISNGALVVKSWRFKRDMRLEANPYYWDAENVISKSVLALEIEDVNTRVLTFETGAADWETDVLVDYVGDMLREKRAGDRDTIHSVPRFGTYFWSFNCTPALTDGRSNPFHDPRVRRAFAMSMSKRDIVEKVRDLGEVAANVIIPPGSIPGFDTDGSIVGAPYNPAAARELLAEAGWIDRDGDGFIEDAAGTPFPTVEMLCSAGSYHDKIALAMGGMWEKSLGVRTRIVVKESKTYKDDLKRRDYMLARGGWFGDFGDPMTFLSLHASGDGNNDRGYSDPEFDAFIDRANDERDPARRMEILEEAERYAMEESLPVLPVWFYQDYHLYDPDEMFGISTHPRQVQYLHWIGKREKGEAPRYNAYQREYFGAKEQAS